MFFCYLLFKCHIFVTANKWLLSMLNEHRMFKAHTPIASVHDQFNSDTWPHWTYFQLNSKMNIETVALSDLQPNILNVSLLICHLFAGGSFRMTHILYHPEVFDDGFFNGLDSACSFQLPKMKTDITTPQITDPIHLTDPQTDFILQMIFLPRY